MKVLVYSPFFYPSVGGLENIMLTLALEFAKLGHQVKVVCYTPSQDSTLSQDRITFPFEIVRFPTLAFLLRLTQWSDVFFQGCVSLKGLWPLLFAPRPLVITHQTWYEDLNGNRSWNAKAKLFVSHFATNIAASQAIADVLPVPATVIPNAYRDDLFYTIPGVERNRDLVFLGRLVSDKGVDLLLTALAQLKQAGLTPSLTIIGSGPEEPLLREQVVTLQLSQQVSFVGTKVGLDLTKLLNAHRIMVVPSRWREPFGIVALEGIACGCVVVGSEAGGLKDAIGPCGVTFPNGDSQALADILKTLLEYPEQLELYYRSAATHLARHHRQVIACEYLKVIESALSCP
ncbi:glycosyltransferase family 4 protein [Trichothermofontia sp.]